MVRSVTPSSAPVGAGRAGLRYGAGVTPSSASVGAGRAGLSYGAVSHTLLSSCRRGQGGSYLTTPRLQSFGDVSDLRQTVRYLRAARPATPIAAAAFSFDGSGLLFSYLGEALPPTTVSTRVYDTANYCIHPCIRCSQQPYPPVYEMRPTTVSPYPPVYKIPPTTASTHV